MYVRDIMTARPRTIRSDSQLHVAQSLFEWGDFRHVPVVDDQGALLGIVSLTDVLRVSASELDESLPPAERVQQLAGVAITDVMNQQPITATPDMPVDEAARCMMRARVNCLPVVDRDQLVGIVTSFDMLGLIGRTPSTV